MEVLLHKCASNTKSANRRVSRRPGIPKPFRARIPGSIRRSRQMTPIAGGKRLPLSRRRILGYPKWLQVISSVLWEHSHSIPCNVSPLLSVPNTAAYFSRSTPLLSVFPGVSSSTFQLSLPPSRRFLFLFRWSKVPCQCSASCTPFSAK